MAGRKGRLTIRFRLGLALAIGLAPILLLGLIQVGAEFHRESLARQRVISQAAGRSALAARARVNAAFALLDSLRPETMGLQCTPRLAEILGDLDGYRNLVRLDSAGRVVCAGASVSADVDRSRLPWFIRLKSGAMEALASSTAGGPPALVVARRVQGRDGAFQGALVASILLSSLRPDVYDPALPAGTGVAILDDAGRSLVYTDRLALSALPADWRGRLRRGGAPFSARDGRGEPRDYALSPLLSGQAVLLIAAPAPSILSWARLNPFSAVILPLLAWIAAWGATWVAVDLGVIRWLSYLDRIASIYARGRFTVRPYKAEQAPEEIRALAYTLNTMADAIVARDLSLRESLAQKDTLMREIHHRVKNNLQVITSLLNMQQRALTDPAARSAMFDTRQRINALALIYRALYQSPDLRRANVRQFLEELVGQMSAGEGGRPAPIRTELQAEDIEIDPDKLAPLALYAVEAISNARKHAFGPAGGAISVRFASEGDEVALTIEDDGEGEAEESSVAGVGRTLMSAFARQLGGRSETAPGGQGGVCVRLVFPRPAPPAEEPEVAAAPRGNPIAA